MSPNRIDLLQAFLALCICLITDWCSKPIATGQPWSRSLGSFWMENVSYLATFFVITKFVFEDMPYTHILVGVTTGYVLGHIVAVLRDLPHKDNEEDGGGEEP